MIHPHANDLSEFTDTQLEQKLLKLNHMYFVTENQDVRQQMILLIDGYKLELEARRVAAKLKQQEEAVDSPLDDLIKVS
tara:strand:+ start:6769 stop:7005 length:237 start_codon:yes stop_codon:yes gene_type:complete